MSKYIYIDDERYRWKRKMVQWNEANNIHLKAGISFKSPCMPWVNTGQTTVSKNRKSVGCIWIFLTVWKSTFFARFSLPGSRCMSDAKTSTKLEQTGEIFWDSRCCLSAWVSAFWARRMKEKWGVTLFMCWLLNTYLPILFKLSHSILDWTVLLWNFWGIFWNIFRGVCGPYHL